MSNPHFLVHGPKDNVGVVVVEGLTPGTEMLGAVIETDPRPGGFQHTWPG